MNESPDSLIVPALTGKFGNWRYYQIILPVEEIVRNFGSNDAPNYRIKSVEEVEEIYSRRGVSNLLQRAFDPRRLDPVKNYLLKQPDKYINNLTLAVFGGSPDWLDLHISPSKEVELSSFADTRKKVGFIKLKGDEMIFVLDGQHRLKGLRRAFVQHPKQLIGEEIVCTLIVHSPTLTGRIRTRRLFSTVNRQAKPVSFGENILLDEDDLSAIIVRSLIEEYQPFKDREIVALSKSGNLNKGEWDKFTNVVTLWQINELLIEHTKVYPQVEDMPKSMGPIRVRPNDKDILRQKKRVFNYWNRMLKLFPSAVTFMKDSAENRIHYRKKGGNFFLRPIAQLALFKVLLSCEQEKKSRILRIRKLPLELSNKFWHYVLWDPNKKSMLFSESHARNYIKYQIGLTLSDKETRRLRETYQKNSGDLRATLPRSKFK